MEKFNVGDIITDSFYNYIVLDIIFEEKEVIGNWGGHIGPHKLKNSYLLLDRNGKFNYYCSFNDAEVFKKVGVSSLGKQTTSKENSCPQCNGELVEKYSEYVGGNIKKCKSCGWC